MEQRDMALIQELARTDETLRQLMQEHESFERRLSGLDQNLYLTPTEEIERKRIQKLNLRGRDRIECILADHRGAGHGSQSPRA